MITQSRIATLYIAYFLLIFISSVIAIAFNDGYLLNRFGATFAGAAALVVCWQIMKEIKLEEQTFGDMKAIWRDELAPSTRDDLLVALDDRIEKRHQMRTRIVFFVGVMLFISELLHGWGDMILKSVGLVDHSSKG